MQNKDVKDVLVIGAGLAGIRAAIAAKQSNPLADITIVSTHPHPHGSSFANVHNQLGIQVCRNRTEQDSFIAEAASIAPPGKINVELTRIMARESVEAFETLVKWGAEIKRKDNGEFLRVRGCFSQHQERAYILLDIKSFYAKLISLFTQYNIEFIPGWQAVEILKGTMSSGRSKVIGATLKKTNGKEHKKVLSKAVILSMGGMACSKKITLAGNGSSALCLHNWCQQNSIPYINKQFTQFVWCKKKTLNDWNISAMAVNGSCYKRKDGKIKTIPSELTPLFKLRSTHTPVSYIHKDRAIDDLLIQQMDDESSVEVFHPDKGWEKVVLAAQASNGGIQIDKKGFTGFPGLFACGECAGGMHGANRIGGAMVLAGQVFGKRAGVAAAESAIL